MREYRIISADSHINTPRDLYQEFAPAKYRDRMPVVESTDEGDFWLFEGTRRPGVVGLSAAAGKKPDEYGMKAVRFDEVRPGSWDTAARVSDGRCCVRTPTSSWSARSATWKRPPRPSRHR